MDAPASWQIRNHLFGLQFSHDTKRSTWQNINGSSTEFISISIILEMLLQKNEGIHHSSVCWFAFSYMNSLSLVLIYFVSCIFSFYCSVWWSIAICKYQFLLSWLGMLILLGLLLIRGMKKFLCWLEAVFCKNLYRCLACAWNGRFHRCYYAIFNFGKIKMGQYIRENFWEF